MGKAFFLSSRWLRGRSFSWAVSSKECAHLWGTSWGGSFWTPHILLNLFLWLTDRPWSSLKQRPREPPTWCVREHIRKCSPRPFVHSRKCREYKGPALRRGSYFTRGVFVHAAMKIHEPRHTDTTRTNLGNVTLSEQFADYIYCFYNTQNQAKQNV